MSCLRPIKIGDRVLALTCCHYFHLDCANVYSVWCNHQAHSPRCPVCRADWDIAAVFVRNTPTSSPTRWHPPPGPEEWVPGDVEIGLIEQSQIATAEITAALQQVPCQGGALHPQSDDPRSVPTTRPIIRVPVEHVAHGQLTHEPSVELPVIQDASAVRVPDSSFEEEEEQPDDSVEMEERPASARREDQEESPPGDGSAETDPSVEDTQPQGETVLPWWPGEDTPTVEGSPFYHASTQLPGDQLSIIVDSGAYTNLIGADLARKLTMRLQQRGMQPTQERLPHSVSIHGVGQGSHKCGHSLFCDIAVPMTNGKARMQQIKAPIVEGDGSALPGLLGFRALNQHRAILDCEKKILYLPGPGDTEFKLPDGTTEIQLQQAPSGHLVMRIDDFENLEKPGGLKEKKRVFHTKETSSSSPAKKLFKL